VEWRYILDGDTKDLVETEVGAWTLPPNPPLAFAPFMELLSPFVRWIRRYLSRPHPPNLSIIVSNKNEEDVTNWKPELLVAGVA